MAIVLNPVTGLRDTTIFPDEPASEAAAREQIQGIIDQVVTQANAQLNDRANKTDFIKGGDDINGWEKNLITGIIEQWGKATISPSGADGSATVTMPIAFSTACFVTNTNIQSVDGINTSIGQFISNGSLANLAQFVLKTRNTNGTGGSTIDVRWRAKGR